MHLSIELPFVKRA